MGSDSVGVVAPLLDGYLSLFGAAEYLPVEKFVPQLAVEAFTIAVLPVATGLTVEGFGT